MDGICFGEAHVGSWKTEAFGGVLSSIWRTISASLAKKFFVAAYGRTASGVAWSKSPNVRMAAVAKAPNRSLW